MCLVLEASANSLLRGVAADPVYPCRSEELMERRGVGRGRGGVVFREVELSERVRERSAGPEEVALARLAGEALLGRAGLTGDERCCLLLTSYWEMSDREIAYLFGKSHTAMQRCRARAVAKLRLVLDPAPDPV